MKRIGIITIQKCNNFGADLQAYALGAKLRSMGYDAENIDYIFYKNPRHQGGKMEKPALPISMLTRVKEFLFPIVSKLRNRQNVSIKKARDAWFKKWFSDNVKVGREYRSVKSLYDNPPKYDVYMVGSDQVWNPRLYSNIKPYFLDFAPNDARRVSYASSLGVSELSGPVFYKYKQWLKNFSYIGLREKKGMDIVNAMALNATVAHVLDPTLLLAADEWQNVAVEPDTKPTGKYLLLYDLIASAETVAFAEKWAKQNDRMILRIGDGAYGPGEFIWLFAHAEAVVTNSFHGTVFSILNHKPFYFVVPQGMTNAGRVESLLSSLSLTDRFVHVTKLHEAELKSGIDYVSVETLLEKLRDQSISFLSDSIEKAPTIKERHLPLSCNAVWHKDDSTRAASTSGGAFTALSEYIFDRGGVVYGAAWDDDLKHVHHRAARSIKELEPLRQSKYVYSEAHDAIIEAKEQLDKGKEVLFSGTPCQCAAMRAAAKGREDKLILVDFVCHGTPLAEVWESYANELENASGSKLASYEFRNKDKGWNFQNIVYQFTNGKKKRVLPWLDPYFHGFSINAFLRGGCYNCPFAKLERISDVTIGDCWRVAASNPEFDDNKGTSLVLINSQKALEIWNRIQASGKVHGGAYDMDLAQCRNMALMHPPPKPNCYDAFMNRFNEQHSFAFAAKAYLTRAKTVKYALLYCVKKLGWFYFRHHQ